MNVLRVKALRSLLLGGSLCAAVCTLFATSTVAGRFGRRSDPAQPLTAALTSVAELEAQRLLQVWGETIRAMETPLAAAVKLTAPLGTGAPVPWQPGLCELGWPTGVNRAGLVAGDTPQGWVELHGGHCVDRQGALAVQALTGPPFPADKDVARLAQSILWATHAAVDGVCTVVSAHAEGTAAVVRVARREGNRVAWAELPLSALPARTGTAAVRTDSLLAMDRLEVGYVHGGPRPGAVEQALQSVKSGKTRALDLDNLARDGAAEAMLGWLHPEEDSGLLAMGGASVILPSAAGNLSLVVVASAPWPWTWQRVVQVTAMGGLLALLTLLVLLVLTARRFADALWRAALEVREAWLGLREDDVGSPEDFQRAQRLVESLTERTRETLEAAFGHGERFWAPSPMGRLLRLVRERLGDGRKSGSGEQ